MEICSLKSGQTKLLLDLSQEFSTISSVQINNGRVAVQGVSSSVNVNIIVLDLESGAILRRCNDDFNCVTCDSFIDRVRLNYQT